MLTLLVLLDQGCGRTTASTSTMAYYHRCDRSFKSDPALQQHKDGSGNHWVCDDCNRDFVSREARIQHYRSSPRHHYCDACDEHFGDEDELKDHDEEEHSYCRDCDEVSGSHSACAGFIAYFRSSLATRRKRTSTWTPGTGSANHVAVRS